MAVDMRTCMDDRAQQWRRRGRTLGFGVGVAQGFATMGRIGFDGRWDYSAIGTVANLASRLCGEAADGQILVSQKVCSAVEAVADIESLGEMTLKGISRPTAVFNVRGLTDE